MSPAVQKPIQNRVSGAFSVFVSGENAESQAYPGCELGLGEVTFVTDNTVVFALNSVVALRIDSDSESYCIQQARVEDMDGADGHNRYRCEIIQIDEYDLISHHRLVERIAAPNEPEPTSPTTAVHESPAWPHMRESVMMLNLSVAQIESSMEDGEKSVGELTQTFFHLSASLKSVYGEMESMFADGGDSEDARHQDVMSKMGDLQGHVNKAIMAFQFYDKLSQRLSHISWALSDMARLVSDLSRVDEEDEWKKLKEEIKKSYSIEEEHDLFDAILHGEDVRAAIKRVTRERAQKAEQSGDDVELF